MKKIICLGLCSLFLFTGCGTQSYLESVEEVPIETDDNQEISTVETDSEDSLEQNKEQRTIFVHVAGRVTNPGVYELVDGSRVFEAIKEAGGLLDDADDSDLNQAAVLSDGEKIYVCSVEEIKQKRQQDMDASDGLVNINTASTAELMTLPGIGESKANQIVSYRESNGAFTKIEDIKNVSGIGDGVFAKIESLIKI